MATAPLPSARADVHPKDHSPSLLPSKTFDVICIGTGWASRVAAAKLVQGSCSALVVEEELVGGDCPFWACIPSKVLLRANEAYQAAKTVGAGESVSKGVVDPQSVFARRDMFTGNYSDRPLLVPMVEDAGVTIARGRAAIVGKKTVLITPRSGEAIEVKAKLAVIIGTGSAPIYPEITGLKTSNIWTPRDATSAQAVPKHLIVLGAGAVGTEMATAWSTFGSKVTLLSRSPEILASVDPEAGKVVREVLQSKGVDVRLGARAVSIQRKGPESVIVKLADGHEIEGSEVLLAAGRAGVHEGLGLDSVGAQAEGKWITVGEDLSVRMQGNDDEVWLYAGGDVTGRALLTHSAKYHGRVIASAILARKQGKTLPIGGYKPYTANADNHAVPQVVFSDPPVASVGLTRMAASKKGVKVREISAPFITLGGRVASDAVISGWAQWLVDGEDRLVGATFAGYGATDVLHASTVAVVGGLKLEQLAHAIPPFPTISEVYLNLLEAAGY